MDHLFEFQIDLETISPTSLIVEDQETQQKEFSEDTQHEIKKTYQCSVPSCGKIFRYKSELKRHSVIHESDRPYSCTYMDCKKTFKRSDALLNHMRIHSEVLPHTCNISGCDKKFASKAALRYHKFTHSNGLGYNSEYCGSEKSFLTALEPKPQKFVHTSDSDATSSKIKEDSNKSESKEAAQTLSKLASSISNQIKWETRSQSVEQNSSGQSAKHRLESLLIHLVNENKLLKEQLNESQKQINYSEHKSLYDMQSDKQSQVFQTEESEGFFDNDEMRFLEFLKERESDSF